MFICRVSVVCHHIIPVNVYRYSSMHNRLITNYLTNQHVANQTLNQWNGTSQHKSYSPFCPARPTKDVWFLILLSKQKVEHCWLMSSFINEKTFMNYLSSIRRSCSLLLESTCRNTASHTGVIMSKVLSAVDRGTLFPSTGSSDYWLLMEALASSSSTSSTAAAAIV